MRKIGGIIINHVTLIGRLTKEVDLKFTSSGVAMGTFTLAVNRSFKNANDEYEADFILCQIWRKSAENLARFTQKGSRIGIEGRIDTSNFENKEGQRVYVTKVIVNQFHLLEPRTLEEQPQRPQQQSNQQPSHNKYDYPPKANTQIDDGRPIDISEDDLPF